MAGRKKRDREEILQNLKVVLAVLLIVAVVFSAVFSYRLGRLVFSDEPMTDSRTENITYDITITPGESTLRVGFELKRAGIIRSAAAFFLQSKVYECKIAPGKYTVYSKNSSKEIMKYLNREYLKKQAEKK